MPISSQLRSPMKPRNHGLDKYYPHGPTCTYNGKEIATYVTCSESGSITSKILRDIIKYLDSNLNFNHSECMPFLLLDGHGSCFELPFLDYMNDERTKWSVSIGVPYGTNLWQVGDSAEQNGSFKIALKKAKQYVIEQKTMFRYACKVEKHDIMGIVHRAWIDSFARKESNKQAIRDRGWAPLVYTLLDHEELK